MKIVIGTSLLTKDGRIIGNGVVINIHSLRYDIETDYGHKLMMTIEELKRLFYIGKVNRKHKAFIKRKEDI